MLGEFASDVPVSVVPALCLAGRWVRKEGPRVSGPLGVLPSAVFVVVTRASWGDRAKWLESASRKRVARMLSG